MTSVASESLFIAPCRFDERVRTSSKVSCSIEGEVKRKYLSHRWSFSCFQPHVLEQRRFRPAVPFAQTLNMSAQRIRLFLSAVFIASFATKPVRSETHKQNGCQWQPYLYSRLVAHCCFGLCEWTQC